MPSQSTNAEPGGQGASGTRRTPAIEQRQLTPDEIRQEIDRVSGAAHSLSTLRSALPVARTRNIKTAETVSADAGVAYDTFSRTIDAGTGGVVSADVAPAAAGAELTPEQRDTVIDQALLMLEDLYAHLPLKRALHAVDPIQRLRLLQLRQRVLDEREFQSEMIDIFVSLRDLHTNYQLPSPYRSQVAYLPIRVEEYYEKDDPEKHRHYLISRVSPRNTNPALSPGLEITHWNGAPIDLAVARNAEREAGSNPEARRGQGLSALTLRWFGASLPPDEDWVTLTFVDGSEVRLAWQVIAPQQLDRNVVVADPGEGVPVAAAMALDVRAEVLRRVRKGLFDGQGIRAEEDMKAYRASALSAPADAPVSVMPDVFPRFGTVTTARGKFGYIRLATFSPPSTVLGPDVDGAVAEFVRILRTMPSSGLILDVRSNGGGVVWFGERILQTLSPRPITPEPFQFVTTPFTHRIASALGWLHEWADPLATAISIGAGFSQGFPITPTAQCNDIGQIYQGPVVLVTDALCYSTTDIFAAGFQDHEIGVVLGCHGNTGAGGANVWDYDFLRRLGIEDNPFVELPGQTNMRVAVRRSTRVGGRAGVPLEDLGVEPNDRHFITRDDLLNNNIDLIEHAGEILSNMLNQTLAVEFAGSTPFTQVRITSSGVDRVDLQTGDRPLQSIDVNVAAPLVVDLQRPVISGGVLTALGYRNSKLVVSKRVTVA
jgi:Peptidase family S41